MSPGAGRTLGTGFEPPTAGAKRVDVEQNVMADGTGGQQFLDRVPTAAALITPTGTALAVNERWAQLLDCRREELVGADFLPFVDPEQLRELRDTLVELAAGRRPTGMALPTRVGHGDRWIEVVCTGLDLLEEEGFGGILVVLRTHWHETDAAARQGWFEAVVNGTDGSVQVVDEHGRFLWASGPLEEMFGLPAEAIVGRTVAQLGAPEVRAATTAWFESILRTPGPHPHVIGPHHAVEGREVQLEVRATNLLHDPEVRGIVLHTRDVSHRVRAEAARQVAIDVLARAPLAIVITDAAGVITSWNAASERILGWPAADVVGRRFRDIGAHTIDSFGAILGSLDRLLNGATVELETQVTTRDGDTVSAYLVASGMLLPDGTFGGFLVFGIDLREQVDVRSALANNEARWAALSRNTHDIVALIDEAASVVWAGAGFANQLGIDPASIIGTNIRELVHPADRARPGGLDRFVREQERGGTYAREYRLRHANGSWRVLDITVTDLREESAIGAFLVSGRDVTDRVAVEEANRRLAVAIDSAGAAVMVTTLDDQVSSWNHGAEALFGVTAEDALGQPLPLRPPPELGEQHADLRARTASGHTVHVETELTRPDGERIPLSVTASPVFDAAGTVSGRSFVCFDATENRKADREREAREKQSTALAGLGQRALAGASVADVLRDACELVSHTLGVSHVHVVLLSADRRFHEIGAAVGLFEPSIGRRDPVEQREWAHLVNRGVGPVVIEDFDASGVERPAALIGCAVRSGVLCRIDGRDGSIGFLGALDEAPRAYLDHEIAFLKALAHVLATAIERTRVSDEMRRRALHDELTGLPNRTLAPRPPHPGPRSPRTARRHGGPAVRRPRPLQAGERHVGPRRRRRGARSPPPTACSRSVRVGDTVARTGGDEFLVLSEEIAGPADAVALAERVAAAVAVPVYVAGHLVHVSASVGVAVTNEVVDADELDPRRRSGHVPGQGAGPGPGPGLRRDHARRSHEPHGDGSGPARRRRHRWHRGGVPAAGPDERRRRHRHRGAGPMEPPAPGRGAALGLRGARRGDRHPRRDHLVGAAVVVRHPPRGPVDRPDPHRGREPDGSPAGRRSGARARQVGAGAVRPARRRPGDRAHRDRGPRRQHRPRSRSPTCEGRACGSPSTTSAPATPRWPDSPGCRSTR